AAGWDGSADLLSPWRVLLDDRAGQWGRLGRFALAWLTPATVCVAIASWRLRPAAAGQVSQRTWLGWRRRRTRSLPDQGNPLLWRERVVHGIAPLAWLRAFPVWFAAIIILFACAAGLAIPILMQVPRNVDVVAVFDAD